jgi:hypothetical protein
MPTLILLSIVLAGIALPIRAARDPDPRRGLRRAAYAMFVYTCIYVVGVLYVLPRVLG